MKPKYLEKYQLPRAKPHQLVQPPARVPTTREAVKQIVETKADDRDAVMNPHKVMQSQWKKWNGVQRRAFNSLFSFAMKNQKLLLHPKGPAMAPEHFRTVAWNFAWAAADSANGKYWGDEMGKEEVKVVDLKTPIKGKPVPKAKKPASRLPASRKPTTVTPQVTRKSKVKAR
jgi:hypothetical protein